MPWSANEEVAATIIATGAEGRVELETQFGCEPGMDPYTVEIETPTICRHIRGWYCTNKADLNIPFTLPQGLKETDVNKAALFTDFSLQGDRWRYRPHDVHILMNRNPILSLYNTIPQGEYTSAFPPSFLNYSQEGAAGNAIQVRSRHMNGGHYVVVSNFTVSLELNKPLEITVCAASEEDAMEKALQKPPI